MGFLLFFKDKRFEHVQLQIERSLYRRACWKAKIAGRA